MSAGPTGWRADPWIRALAKSLLAKPSSPARVAPASRRDGALWEQGGERVAEARHFLSIWALTGEVDVDFLSETPARPLRGASILLRDEDALRAAFFMPRREESFRQKTIAALISDGMEPESIAGLEACLLGAALSPAAVASGLRKLRGGSFPSKRSASAQCFAGDSKFLDGREMLLARAGQSKLRPSPLLVNAWLPSSLKSALFVENLDTFSLLCGRDDFERDGMAVVYAKGFAASAERMLDPKGRIAFVSGAAGQAQALEGLLNGEPLPSYFFGDLDWAGLSIFEALKKNFPRLEMWAEGCACLIAELNAGGGHLPSEAKKMGQTPISPALLTDPLAVEMALLIARTGRFLDQEFFGAGQTFCAAPLQS